MIAVGAATIQLMGRDCANLDEIPQNFSGEAAEYLSLIPVSSVLNGYEVGNTVNPDEGNLLHKATKAQLHKTLLPRQ